MNQQQATVKIAVVGHANTGKTSLIRTLLRDSGFGEVADYAGTTRHVEAASLNIEGQTVIELFDTPGMEDSVALKQLWTRAERRSEDQSISKAQQMTGFIEYLDQLPDFAQEQKVLKQAFRSDVLLYVIDAREPYLGKYQDEIALLAATGRPIVPVLNFVSADQDNKARWRERLKDQNLHAVVEYDTVAFTMQAEQRLYEKLQSMSEAHYAVFQRVIDFNLARFRQRRHAAASAIAEQFINVAAYRIRVSVDEIDESVQTIQSLVRKAEQKTVDQLLGIFGFDKNDVRGEFLPVENGRWQLDLFDSNTYKEFGVHASSGAAKGAALGVGVDLFVGGVSLGVGAAIGAVAGVVWSSAKKYGGALRNKVTGSSYLIVEDATIELFYLRQRYLLNSLLSRGHASQNVVAIEAHNSKLQMPEQQQAVMRQLRNNHRWSHLDAWMESPFFAEDEARTQCKETIAKGLLDD